MPGQWEHKDLYREIVTTAQEGMMVIGMNGKIVMLNPAAEQMLGLTQEDVGNSFANVFLLREGTDEFTEAILDTIYEKGKVSSMPVDYLLDGKTRNLSLTTSYIRNEGEKSVVVVISDVTELNELRDAQKALDRIEKLNREYEKAKDEAVRANEAKSLFLSNMSHEIRTPINAVLGMNEMILRECTDKQLLSYAANIQSSGKTLLFLINDILDMSKVEAGKMELVNADYHIKNVADEVINMMDGAASKRGILLKCEYDMSIPCKYYGDEGRIRQILINLLNNGLKFTKEGYVKLSVGGRPGEDADTELLHVEVRDTGCGIKEEDLGKIFENFSQVDAKRNRSVEGTGLGLSITRHLVELMRGTIRVESVYGEGTVFILDIPQKIVDRRSLTEMPKEIVRKEDEIQAFTAEDCRVLVVDDNLVNRKVARGFLRPYGFVIDEAESGQKSIECVRQTRYDIIFMDHMMPEMDGIEAVQIIRSECGENGTQPVIIALTANAMEGVREMFLKNGFQDFITKPLDKKGLNETLKKWIPEQKRKEPDTWEQSVEKMRKAKP